MKGFAVSVLALLALTAVPAASASPPPCQAKTAAANYKGSSALADAIAAAASGDTIDVLGTCVGNFRLDKNLTLAGHNATLDGNRTGRVVRIAAGVTAGLSDLTITNGKTASLGGGIYLAGTAVLNGVTVIRNEGGANNFGGGIEADGGSTLTLIDSIVRDNVAGGSGGIDIFEGATVSLVRTTVTRNHATGVTTDGCMFGSAFYSCAGGVWNYHATLALVDSDVTRNEADYRGGGMRVDATFTDGGQVDGVTLLSGSSKITSNSAGDQGGGIWASGRTPDPSSPGDFLPHSPDGAVQAADGTSAFTDPVSGATLPAWTGSISRNTPDQCFPQLTIGGAVCS